MYTPPEPDDNWRESSSGLTIYTILGYRYPIAIDSQIIRYVYAIYLDYILIIRSMDVIGTLYIRYTYTVHTLPFRYQHAIIRELRTKAEHNEYQWMYCVWIVYVLRMYCECITEFHSQLKFWVAQKSGCGRITQCGCIENMCGGWPTDFSMNHEYWVCFANAYQFRA